MDQNGEERAAVRARQLWAAHGYPAGGYGAFLFQATQEIALTEDLRRICTRRILERVHRAVPDVPRAAEPHPKDPRFRRGRAGEAAEVIALARSAPSCG